MRPERLRKLLAECEALRKRSRTLSADTVRMIARTERRIAECVERVRQGTPKKD